jgi:hypothetical protein
MLQLKQQKEKERMEAQGHHEDEINQKLMEMQK